MIPRRVLLGALALLTATAAAPAAATERLPVVASFSILGDLVAQVGGDHVAVTTLVGPDGDAHVYQPTPSDARAVAVARLVVVNGLGFEGWMTRLIEAAGYQGPVVVAASGITPRPAADGHTHGHGHGRAKHAPAEDDPHAWQDVRHAIRYVTAIADALVAADPANAASYRTRAAAYGATLEALDAEVRSTLGAVPARQRRVITSHGAFGYYAAAYGVTFLAAVGVSTEAEASAGDVARLIRQIRNEGVRAIFVENVSDPRLVQQIARETKARVGGKLYSDALSGPDGPAATYVDMIRHNTRTIAAALAGV
jgi:zinc/manganese transport system substrate-binding protein